MAHHFTNDKRMDYLVQLAAGALAGMPGANEAEALASGDWEWYAKRASYIAAETLANLELRLAAMDQAQAARNVSSFSNQGQQL